MTPGWCTEYGGLHRVRAHDGQLLEVTPEFNSIPIFDVDGHRDHEVTEVLSQNIRLSLNAWMLEPELTAHGGDDA
jgi:Rps23 Pro-64 3,4-dihydroxylase Tpa1-like proline 4-hydroxylase